MNPDEARAPSPAGPATHYDLFAALRDAGVDYLVTGAVALVLHGVPRLTADLDLAADPDDANVARLGHLLAAWGYGEAAEQAAGAGGGPAIRRFRHPGAGLGEIDVVLPEAAAFARLRAGATAARLVDVDIPVIGADHLLALSDRTAGEVARGDAAGLRLLAAQRTGADAGGDDTRAEQIRKFSRWSVAARLDWLLAAARLGKGLSPEARPMTRGLRRKHWYPGR